MRFTAITLAALAAIILAAFGAADAAQDGGRTPPRLIVIF